MMGLVQGSSVMNRDENMQRSTMASVKAFLTVASKLMKFSQYSTSESQRLDDHEPFPMADRCA